MAHFAELDENNVVLRVVTVDNDVLIGKNGIEEESLGIEYLTNLLGGTWLQTSYNTKDGKHILGKKQFRKNYACPGGTYDSVFDCFIDPKPYPSWNLIRAKGSWVAPVPYPEDDKFYIWNEESISWMEVTE